MHFMYRFAGDALIAAFSWGRHFAIMLRIDLYAVRWIGFFVLFVLVCGILLVVDRRCSSDPDWRNSGF